MKRLLVVVIAVLVISSLVSAQSAQNVWGQGKMSAGVGLEIGLPSGDWGNAVGTGFGGFGLFQYGVNEDVLATGQIGYTSWGNKDQGGYNTNGSDLAFLVGGKYNLSKSVTPGFYGALQLGIYSATVSRPAVTIAGYGTIPSASVTQSKFVFIPAVGYQVGPIDASVKYVINGDVGNIALNVAYIFQL